MMIRRSDIVLIGPVGTGKSTLGKLLSARLGLPAAPMDRLCWRYYDEIGFDGARSRELNEKEGLLAPYRYWKPFEAYAVERLLAEHHDCIIDFGAGHSVYEEEALFRRVQQALAPYDNVVFVLPSPDLDESIRILHDRAWEQRHVRWVSNGFDFQEHWVKHRSNHELAKYIIYTEGNSPEETAEEVLGLVRPHQ